MIKLSIIIPHYNSVKLLKKLLDSIPLDNEIQIIVIDDRSDRDLTELNSLMHNDRYRHVLFLNNDTHKKGAGVCRNIGLRKAEGKWILFADADDYFVNGFYNIVSKFFSSDYEVVFFNFTSIEIDTGKVSDRHVFYENIMLTFLEKKDLTSELSLRYRIAGPCSKLIRNSFLKEHKIFFDEVIASNDLMFSTKLGYYMQKFHVAKEVIYCVTRSRGSLTMKTNENIYDVRLMVFINYCNFLKSHLDNKDLKKLKLNGQSMIINAIKYKLGLKKILLVYMQLKKNKIKIFNLRCINPFFLIRKGYSNYSKYKNEKKYRTK